MTRKNLSWILSFISHSQLDSHQSKTKRNAELINLVLELFTSNLRTS